MTRCSERFRPNSPNWPARWTLLSFALAIAIALIGRQTQARASETLTPEHLRCEYLTNPVGIDEAQPRLSWIVTSAERGQRQTAYQVLAASSEAELDANRGDLWDSGRVASNKTAHIEYDGKPLSSTQRIWWKVRVWDQADRPSTWSDASYWEMGLLSADDWHGQWIAQNTNTDVQPLPLLRRDFTVKDQVKRARLYVTGLGYFEATINGRRIGDHRLDPGYTRYDRRVLYVTHDVTAAIRGGTNAIGVMLGNGWYNVQAAAPWDFNVAPWRASPRLLAELRIELADGRTEVISTDESWKTAAGPIIFSSIYGGETYDARLENPGWDSPEFDDSDWQAAVVVDPPQGRLAAQMMPAIKVSRIITPVSVSEPEPGVYLFDVGQNLTGFAELTVSGPAGTRIAMKYSELLGRDGRADQANIGVHVWARGKDQSFQTDTYVLKGSSLEKWHSRFVYHGFQYVEVSGAPTPLTTENLRIHFQHTAVPEVGHFECSNPLLNRIWENTRWSYLSNLQGIPTDCPHREKNGWTGDAHLACEQALWNYDAAAVYTKWINDLGDEQQPDGRLPGIVPTGGWGYAWGNGPAWDSAFLLIPDYLHLYCGDTRLRERHCDGHRSYVDYLTQRARNGIVRIGLGDWSPASTTTPEAVTSTGYYYRDARIVAQTAKMLGRDKEADIYNTLADRIRNAFNREFFKSETGQYANGSQTALSCALYQGLAEPANEARVLQNLVADIERKDGHLDTGILGAKYLLHALSDHGRADLAYQIASQDTQPSWGWWISQGATTLWEGWGQGDSHNHIFYGDVVNWFYRTLAGINPDPAAPGFHHIIIDPHTVGDLTWVKARYDSICGRIASEWTKENGQFKLRIVIPANASATVYLPTEDVDSVRESNHRLDDVDGVKFKTVEDGRAILNVGSGEYVFTTKSR
jgi:alpha-L-rhamnosidase